jgi:hypothetical protein
MTGWGESGDLVIGTSGESEWQKPLPLINTDDTDLLVIQSESFYHRGHKGTQRKNQLSRAEYITEGMRCARQRRSNVIFSRKVFFLLWD